MTRKPNIVLVGFMGTGKTATGKRLATELGMTFVDMDAIIVQRQGKPVTRIFSEHGEPYFRACERALAVELSATSGNIIATGGGIVINPDNIRDLASTGLVVCLTATPEAILRRIQHDTSRPLLAEGDKLQKITDLLAKRREMYAAIPCSVDTTTLTLPDVVAAILEHYRKHRGA
jgi:shikimate kinase